MLPSTTTRALASFVAVCALNAACSDDTARAPGPEDASPDIASDVTTDARGDTDTTDATDATDAVADAASDVADVADVASDARGTDAPDTDTTPDAAVDIIAPDAPGDVPTDLTTDVTDAGADAPREASVDAPTDVAGDTGALDVALDTTTSDVIAADARADAPGDGVGPGCATGAECATGLCLFGRCARYTDESLPITSVPSPDRCRMRVGVDQPTGSPLRMITVVPSSTGDTGYESVRTGTAWTQRTLATNVSRYTTPRFHRMTTGALEVDFVQGTTAYLGPRGSVTQSGFSDYETAYSPTGELTVVVKNQGTGTFSYPYPLRLWRMTGTTWASDLVVSSIGSDGGAALHYRTDGTPDALAFGPTSATLYRKALDVWNATPLYTGPGTHAGGVIALHDPRGGTHVIFGTRVFTIDLSVGELTLDYFFVGSDGTIARRERLPVGGHGFTFIDATLAADGSVYAMVTAPPSGGRFATHVVRIGAAGVASTVVANFETAMSSCSLAVAPDNTMYLAVYQGYMRPVLLRTFSF